jgi:hypothetical protein
MPTAGGVGWDGSAMLVLQITPKGPGGVSDCAQQLQRYWQEAGTRCQTLAVSADSSPSNILLEILRSEPAAAILLHFSGYGYAPRGLCHWLTEDLARVLRVRPDITFVTFFHEIFAKNAPPWRSGWWAKPEQQRIAADLSRLSDTVWTTTSENRDWLTRRAPAGKTICLRPVISNVGEVASPKPASTRSYDAVLFGSSASRRMSIQAPAFARNLRALGIRRLTEIGPGEPVGSIGCPTDVLGALPPEKVSEILADTSYGVTHYRPALFGKSGVVAAYAAHGCAPLVTGRDDPRPLEDGCPYLHLSSARGQASDLDRIAAGAHAWYQPHRLARQAEDLKSLLLADGHRLERPSRRNRL